MLAQSVREALRATRPQGLSCLLGMQLGVFTSQPASHHQASTASFSTASENVSERQGSTRPQIVVFGGRGFVGSHVLQEALNQGLHVISISRSGTPPVRHEPWTQQVEWVRGNALEPRTYESVLKGSLAAISCVGGFGSQEQMMQANGTANVKAIEAAAAAGVPRFVFVSAHIPNIPGIDILLQGYVQGKKIAEAAVKDHFPESGVILRPGVIYGNRVISSTVTLPLQYVFQPVEALLSKVPAAKQLSQIPFLGAAMVPPVNVQTVAKAAVRAATDSTVTPGIIDVWELPQYK